MKYDKAKNLPLSTVISNRNMEGNKNSKVFFNIITNITIYYYFIIAWAMIQKTILDAMKA